MIYTIRRKQDGRFYVQSIDGKLWVVDQDGKQLKQLDGESRRDAIRRAVDHGHVKLVKFLDVAECQFVNDQSQLEKVT